MGRKDSRSGQGLVQMDFLGMVEIIHKKLETKKNKKTKLHSLKLT